MSQIQSIWKAGLKNMIRWTLKLEVTYREYR